MRALRYSIFHGMNVNQIEIRDNLRTIGIEFYGHPLIVEINQSYAKTSCGIGCLRVHRYFGHTDMCLTDFKIELEIDEKKKILYKMR